MNNGEDRLQRLGGLGGAGCVCGALTGGLIAREAAAEASATGAGQ